MQALAQDQLSALRGMLSAAFGPQAAAIVEVSKCVLSCSLSVLPDHIGYCKALPSNPYPASLCCMNDLMSRGTCCRVLYERAALITCFTLLPPHPSRPMMVTPRRRYAPRSAPRPNFSSPTLTCCTRAYCLSTPHSSACWGTSSERDVRERAGADTNSLNPLSDSGGISMLLEISTLDGALCVGMDGCEPRCAACCIVLVLT